MSTGVEWFRRQGEHSKRAYELLHADRRGMADWKVTVPFRSGLHRINYRFGTKAGSVPCSHVERKRRAKGELRRVFDGYGELYLMSRRARYCTACQTTGIYAFCAARTGVWAPVQRRAARGQGAGRHQGRPYNGA